VRPQVAVVVLVVVVRAVTGALPKEHETLDAVVPWLAVVCLGADAVRVVALVGPAALVVLVEANHPES